MPQHVLHTSFSSFQSMFRHGLCAESCSHMTWCRTRCSPAFHCAVLPWANQRGGKSGHSAQHRAVAMDGACSRLEPFSQVCDHREMSMR